MTSLTKNVTVLLALEKDMEISIADGESLEEAVEKNITDIGKDWEIENFMVFENENN